MKWVFEKQSVFFMKTLPSFQPTTENWFFENHNYFSFLVLLFGAIFDQVLKVRAVSSKDQQRSQRSPWLTLLGGEDGFFANLPDTCNTIKQLMEEILHQVM